MNPSGPTGSVIRLAQVSDAAALAVLAAQTFALACPPGTDPADIASHLASHLSVDFFAATVGAPDAAIYVAQVGSALVGYALVYITAADLTQWPDSIGPETAAELSKCYVLPAWQGKGLAQQLVQVALNDVGQRQIGGIWLGVNEHNHRARAFYAKMGFVPVGRRSFVVGRETHDDLVLERTLGDDAPALTLK